MEPKLAEEFDRLLSSKEERRCPIFLRRNANIVAGGYADPPKTT